MSDKIESIDYLRGMRDAYSHVHELYEKHPDLLRFLPSTAKTLSQNYTQDIEELEKENGSN